MSSGSTGVSLPVSRPSVGRALVVASPSSRAALVAALSRLGFDCGESDDPYTAALELCRHRLAYRALILSLASLFREELALVSTVKRRFPHVEIWLAHTDGRQAALAECMRLGADGLFDDEGLHRIAAPVSAQEAAATYQPMPALPISSQELPIQPPAEPERAAAAPADDLGAPGEPVLTAEELRALLQDPPVMPPSSAGAPHQSHQQESQS
ncbi:MAG TPA: hypothetical protein VH518_14110 [Tepidisphaeraceae bacterium]